MKRIKYYDEINGEEIELEVNEEIEMALSELDKEERMQKNRERKYELSLDAVNNSENLLIDPTDNPLEALIKKEEGANRKRANRINLLRRGIKTLNEKEQEVIKHIYWKDYTQAELARKLQVARSTIKRRCDSAINKLKEYILNNE